jgi:hypothetical protein
MAFTTRTSIVINKPVEAVWAYLDDHSNETGWRRPSLKRLEQIGARPGVGTRYPKKTGLESDQLGRMADRVVRKLHAR